uniref:Uncharacterized protein n=1 Tax=Haemonchus placei TaxID=6290 RepID=A0A0N4W153_HAEPC
MDSERSVDQPLGVGDPVTVPDIDQVINDTQPGSPPPPVPVDSTDPSVGDSTVLDDASPVNDEEPIDCEVTVLSHHIPAGGYLSTKLVKRLFPHTFKEKPHVLRRLPVIEVMRLEHAVAFRQASHTIIDQLIRGQYTATENTAPPTPEGSMPGAILPRVRAQLPVLYQVVNKGLGQGVILEAKISLFLAPTDVSSISSFSVCNERRKQFLRILSVTPLCKGPCVSLHRRTNYGGHGAQAGPYSEGKRS